jgi:hypothetical protein
VRMIEKNLTFKILRFEKTMGVFIN